MGGTITVEGTTGRGCTFCFTAHFGVGHRTYEPSPATTTIMNQTQLIPRDLEGIHVLLVEDQPLNQQVAQELLATAGIVVQVAHHGQEAVRMTEEGRYDLILMDLQMPIMDGYTATRQIRQQWNALELPIIAMTAHAMESERGRCLEAGMNDYLSKPIDVRTLYGTLHAWSRHRSNNNPPPAASAGKFTLPPDLPTSLPGLNLQEGLERLGGNFDLYRRLVIGFACDKRNTGYEIRAAMAESDGEKAGDLAHAVRGAAGNISAFRLHATLSSLETALRKGDLDTAGLLQPELEEGMAEVLAAAEILVRLQTAIKHTEQKPIDQQELSRLLQKLGTLTARNNLKVMKHLPQLTELATGTHYAPFVASLVETLERLDFVTASRQIENMAGIAAID